MTKDTIKILEASAVESFYRLLNKILWGRKYPRDYGTGELLHMAEIEVIDQVANVSEVTMSRLAEELGISKAAISPVVNKLESKGYLIKTASKLHGNIRYLSLTAKGKIASRGVRAYRRRLYKYLKGVKKTEFEVLIKLLRQMEGFVDDLNEELRAELKIERMR
jgi:DNA-binding MarR family transcriptional regulator